VSAVLVNSLYISSKTQKDLRMKAVVLGLIAFVGSCHSAGIPVVAKVGHGMAAVTPPIGAAGGFKSSGVFAGPFFAQVTTVVGKAKPPPIPFVPIPFIGAPTFAGGAGCKVCNVGTGDEGICQPVSGYDKETYGTYCKAHGQHFVGDCSEMGPGAQVNDAKMGCCQSVIGCGETFPEDVHLAYYRNPSWPESDKGSLSCNIVIKVLPKVCQLRIDFLEFELPAPDVRKCECSAKNSMVFHAPQKPLGILGRTDQGLCGINTGQHLYIPVAEEETLQIITTLDGHMKVPYHKSSLAADQNTAYKWNIKITQIECTEEKGVCFQDLKAPDGCVQYYKESFGKITSFNFDGISHIAENLDYSICINPEVEFAKGITLRANIFKMPVGGKDIVCASGHEIVNKKTAVDCCLAPQSGYIGITAWQPYSRDWKKRALRRYWCGLELGTDNQITTEDFIFRVVTGEDYKCKFDPIGFDIEYKVDTGM